jgi:hypothetical protein
VIETPTTSVQCKGRYDTFGACDVVLFKPLRYCTLYTEKIHHFDFPPRDIILRSSCDFLYPETAHYPARECTGEPASMVTERRAITCPTRDVTLRGMINVQYRPQPLARGRRGAVSPGTSSPLKTERRHRAGTGVPEPQASDSDGRATTCSESETAFTTT